MATVGKGKYTYELVPDWEKLPEGWALGQTAIVTGLSGSCLSLQPRRAPADSPRPRWQFPHLVGRGTASRRSRDVH